MAMRPEISDEADANAGRGGPIRTLVAWATSGGGGSYEAAMAQRKRLLLRGLRGRVLEIGPGAGANLRYYARDVEWIGVEPSRPMQARLRRSAERSGIAGRIVTGTAERLPLPDASIDAVVSTLVLCSVTDVGRTLDEIRRVLRPGGRFVFIEHVAAPPGTRHRCRQRLLRPVWRILGDGCRPDQDTAWWIERAGFSALHAEHFDAAAGLLAPHYAGVAIR